MISTFDITLEGSIYLKVPDTTVGDAIKVKLSGLEKEEALKLRTLINETYTVLLESDYSITYLGPHFSSILKIDSSAQTPSIRRRLEEMARISYRESIAGQLNAFLKEEK